MNWTVTLMRSPQSRFDNRFAGSAVFHGIGQCLIGLATPNL